MTSYVTTALQYLDMGLSVVPVNHLKKATDWQGFQSRRMTPAEVISRFSRSCVHGIAIVAGSISGDFEGLDFDTKYDLTGSLFSNYWHKLSCANPELAARLVKATTKNRGQHLYYRCSEVGRHLELARRMATPEELRIKPSLKTRTLIETRSNGQYIIVPPSWGYQFEQNDLCSVPLIQPPERKILLDLARAFDRFAESELFRERYGNRNITGDPHSPLDDYDQRGDVIGLLKKHGWVVVSEKPDQILLRRPGNTKQWCSASFNHLINRFFAYTHSTDFIARKPYKPSAVYAFLECNRNFSVACQQLLLLGYGISYKDQREIMYNSVKHHPCKRRNTE